MPGFQPRRDGMPAVFPVFPLLGALLLPRGRLPLNIFEPRYLALVEDAMASGRMFGMIQPDSSLPPHAHGSGLFKIGCLGRLSSFSETEDGRFLITLTGLVRFQVCEELDPQRGYRRVRADWTGFLSDLDPPPAEPKLPRDALMHELRGYFSRSGLEANWDAIHTMPDDMLVNTLCMVCPFEPAEKQALLEAATEADRAATLMALLQMGGMEPHDSPPGRPAS